MATSLIKTLQTAERRGAPIDFKTLQRHGVSSALAHDYVKSGWLERLGRGVFMFAGDELERDGTLKFLESRMPDLHVAAKTALAWHGFQQNVSQANWDSDWNGDWNRCYFGSIGRFGYRGS